jgi:methylamine utilization protein MauJ
MDISLDNSRRFRRKRYMFEYRDIRFKLVQERSRRFCDHLLTLIPNGDRSAEDRAFSIASEFASALAWQNAAMVAVHYGGGGGRADDTRLEVAEPFIQIPHRIPSAGFTRNYEPDQIPKIQTNDQRVALALFREARASNNLYLSFLMYWQVIEVGNHDAIGFINKTLSKRRDRLRLSQDDVKALELGPVHLGNYLSDNCRHAIAHFRRTPGKVAIDVDSWSDRCRLMRSTRVIESFASFYIVDALKLTEKLYLAKPQARGGFPKFVDSSTLESECLKLALSSRISSLRRPRKLLSA